MVTVSVTKKNDQVLKNPMGLLPITLSLKSKIISIWLHNDSLLVLLLCSDLI